MAIKKKKAIPGLKSSIKDAVEKAESDALIKIEETDKLVKDVKSTSEDKSIELIPIDKIVEIEYNDGKFMHNRTGLVQSSREKIKLFANSILKLKPEGLFKTGLLQQITVRKKPNTDLYERIIGFRRLEAFKENNEKFIPATVIECDNKTARLIRNEENDNREDLSSYDKLLGHLEAIQLYANFPDMEEVKNFLYRCKHHNNKKNSFSFNDDEISKMAFVEKIATEKVGVGVSRLADKLEILNFEENIKDALHNNKITETNAILVNRIKEKEFKDETLNWVITNNPTKSKLREYIFNNKNEENRVEESKSSISQIKEYTSKIRKSDFAKLSGENRAEAEKKLLSIQENLKELLTLLN